MLDVGCGPGFLGKRLAIAVGPTGRVEGLDPSPQVIDYARARAAPNVTYTVGGAQALSYDDECFDYVFSTLVLHHIPPQDRSQALRETYRVLKPAGGALIADIRPRHATRHGNSDVSTGHADISALLEEVGFRLAERGNRGHGIRYVTALRP